MDVLITPEPTEVEREAILRALALERGEPQVPPAWWRAGLQAEAGDEDGYATTSPRRQSRGATRA